MAAVRILQLSPDMDLLDVAVRGTPVLFQRVGFAEYTGYTLIQEGIYDVEIRLSGTGIAVLKLPMFTLTEGQVYSIYIEGYQSRVGTAQALQLIPILDI